MELLDAGVDSTVISLWLGHESTRSTQPYLHAHLAIKEAALQPASPFNKAHRAYQVFSVPWSGLMGSCMEGRHRAIARADTAPTRTPCCRPRNSIQAETLCFLLHRRGGFISTRIATS
ncbi:hypothetical protein OLZ32_21875 [Rhizobium sp. 1AS11]|uniref:hypothetical protein n=1 Tax=Rhizobium acaciae TaxID=2989736 RepID=UPI0022237DD2|nr:hypothetical protein [Rhizobium acaciae]MCW1743032.1 hypothetical protein [Rhizobium acaciae]